jgi:16S rRNA (cytosine967-C5)-methyltransferase
MTPGARVAAAIEVLDEILEGQPAEKALTRWARRSRFAGSKDRAAVRDYVFDVIRKYQSCQGDTPRDSSLSTGRQMMIRLLQLSGVPLDEVFTGLGHAPPQLTADERSQAAPAEHPNMPDWVFEALSEDVGIDVAWAQARLLAERAPVSIRANRARVTRGELEKALRDEGFNCHANPLCETALTIDGAARGLTGTQSFLNGMFEMQDAGSQAVIDALILPDAPNLLDFCAGGGGKSLALAARTGGAVTAHDANAARLRDIPNRAERSGADVIVLKDRAQIGFSAFDLVLLDVPCSGSGSWRRAPDAKWRFERNTLEDLVHMQRDILEAAQRFVSESGSIAYVTCSLLKAENEDQKDWFLASFPDWALMQEKRWFVSEHGDGFYLAQFQRTRKP